MHKSHWTNYTGTIRSTQMLLWYVKYTLPLLNR